MRLRQLHSTIGAFVGDEEQWRRLVYVTRKLLTKSEVGNPCDLKGVFLRVPILANTVPDLCKQTSERQVDWCEEILFENVGGGCGPRSNGTKGARCLDFCDLDLF